MAYGMQLPQVPFSYFYPTKIPSQSGNGHTPPTTTTTTESSKHTIYPKLSGPLNFSKRETTMDSTIIDDEMDSKVVYHHSQKRNNNFSPLVITKQHSSNNNNMHHKTINVNEDDEKISDENENVEID